MKLSQRQKTAGIEQSRHGVGVSTTARMYARKYYSSWGWSDLASMRNAELNDILAQDFMRAESKHQFKLRSGDMAEIRQSQNMYYVAVNRGGNNYDIIAIQSGYKARGPGA